jgi:hypothetical protein
LTRYRNRGYVATVVSRSHDVHAHAVLRSPLWREGDFVKFWSAATVSLAGDAVTRLALPLIAIVLLDATPFEVGLLGGAQFVPFLLVGLPAGAIVDRLARKRRLLVAADYARLRALLDPPTDVATPRSRRAAARARARETSVSCAIALRAAALEPAAIVAADRTPR